MEEGHRLLDLKRDQSPGLNEAASNSESTADHHQSAQLK
jgi:hypothetical protein